jgi:cyclophilin family peptidyl-prolyl cis-trans isomerase
MSMRRDLDRGSLCWALACVALLGIAAGTRPARAQDAKDAAAKETPAAEKPADKPAADKPAEPAAEKPAAEKPAVEKPAAEKPAAEKPTAEKPTAEKPTAEKPTAEKPAAEKPAAEPAGDPDAAKKFDALLTAWKAVLKELRDIKIKYQTAPDSETEALKKQWDAAIARGESLMPQLLATGKAAYLAAPNVDLNLTRFLVRFVADSIEHDDFEPAFELAELLIANQCEVPEIYQFAGTAAFCVNEFTKAEAYFKQAQEAGVLTNETAKKFQGSLAEYKQLWPAEEEIRKKEAEKNDLPRVKLATTKGDVIVELFENEAPETVGNFVSLVESKFYDGRVFHRVLPNFMAQGGCPIGNGTGDAGYKIYCETEKPNHRNHFRGTLSMAHAGKDTGGSQFFLTFVPTPHLNGRHTAFGRVVEGLDVLAKLQRIDPDAPVKPEPDKIVKAEVVRKRDHKYEPNKVK